MGLYLGSGQKLTSPVNQIGFNHIRAHVKTSPDEEIPVRKETKKSTLEPQHGRTDLVQLDQSCTNRSTNIRPTLSSAQSRAGKLSCVQTSRVWLSVRDYWMGQVFFSTSKHARPISFSADRLGRWSLTSWPYSDISLFDRTCHLQLKGQEGGRRFVCGGGGGVEQSWRDIQVADDILHDAARAAFRCQTFPRRFLWCGSSDVWTFSVHSGHDS